MSKPNHIPAPPAVSRFKDVVSTTVETRIGRFRVYLDVSQFATLAPGVPVLQVHAPGFMVRTDE